MALWEIRLADQPPLVVDVEDGRNLAVELTSLVQAALATKQRAWWKIWEQREIDPYWQITDRHRYHLSVIAGVKPAMKPKRDKRTVIGFKLPDAGE